MIGKTLGNFEITSLIGKGGMGEVYQAKDLKLGRDVAIKVLPEEFAKDIERVARFQREAKLLASLNHPNIAAIHGLEESDGVHFLVLELIEGDTLADRLKHGAVPVEESLKLTLQIAEALEAAHEKGVIHRDLKPANIKITPDGKAKVLDFGLAKALAHVSEDMNLSDSPTLSAAATQQGVILGTAAYMSPEQARGKSVDKRSDIWAFGCVLYECLTGRQPFRGEMVSDILAAVLLQEPDLSILPADTPPRARELLERCLVKEPKDRLRDIGDARQNLERAEGSAASVAKFAGIAAEAIPPSRTGVRSRRASIPALIVAVVLGAWACPIGNWCPDRRTA
jgi:serine/threonine protein kinase